MEPLRFIHCGTHFMIYDWAKDEWSRTLKACFDLPQVTAVAMGDNLYEREV